MKKKLSFCLRKLSDLCLDLSLFFKRKSAEINPYTALNNLDKKIAKFLPSLLNKKTFYIEVGANDGITQSNTYFLEKIYGAKGMLIEASPSLFEKCSVQRNKENIFEHCALVSSDYNKPFVELIYGDLYTTASNSADVIPREHAELGVKRKLPFKKLLNLDEDPVYNFFAPAISLNNLIEKHSINSIDLLSLDVEGNELSVLEGCNLSNGKIKNIIIESRSPKQIDDYLSRFGYVLIKQLSYHDYLYSKNYQ